MKENIELILRTYNNVIDGAICLFLKKHFGDEYLEDFDLDTDIHWIGDDVGEVFDFADYVISFSDVIQDLKLDAPEGLFFEWYDYSIESNGNNINYRSWIKGIRHKTPYEIKQEKLKKAKEVMDRQHEAYLRFKEEYDKINNEEL